MKVIAAVATLVATAAAATVSYDGYKVYRVPVGESADDIDAIIEKLGLSTWEHSRQPGSFADVVVPPETIELFEKEAADLGAVTMHEDLGASIAEESAIDALGALRVDNVTAMADITWFNNYHPYADHLQFLRELQTQFPSNARVVTSGSSLQGNAITGIQLFGSTGGGSRPAIIFHGNVHAREWITSMTVEYFAWTLLSGYASNTEIRGFLDRYDFYLFPVVNPDGFIYSQTSDRLWRKNRQSVSGSTCLGTDINRNWNYQWAPTGGASTSPCAQDYKGPSAASAPETRALTTFAQNIRNTQGLKLYIDWHSYSQLFMSAYGYSCTAVPANNAELQTLNRGAAAAIQAVHGTAFDYGPICSTIYRVTGGGVDYVQDVIRADYVFTAELRDTGRYGFVLPANQILPTGQESYAAVRYLLLNMR
ncbi:zinc carboxypeptidase [Stachybotrys elegans]|uniref:Zinc carboxypeptidase n=1 Tax=Stachybotrys elegans TaxID=80388 RepID=A0A8K0STM9_9HYPO|nr:zinc carboxypeptidase [Stachybotrys elegans]